MSGAILEIDRRTAQKCPAYVGERAELFQTSDRRMGGKLRSAVHAEHYSP
jgi:hypothetical protein